MRRFVLAAALLVAAVGCQKHDVVADDLVHYIDNPVHTSATDWHDAMTAMQALGHKSNAEVADALRKDVIPKLDHALTVLKGFQAATPDVKALNDQRVQQMQTYDDLMHQFADAVAANDDAKVKDTMQKVDGVYADMKSWNDSVDKLADAHHLKRVPWDQLK